MLMRVADQILFLLGRGLSLIAAWAWDRFLGLLLIGKGFAIALTLFAAAWAADQLGMNSIASEVGSAGWLVLSLVLTAVVIRHIWLRFTRRSRYPTWY